MRTVLTFSAFDLFVEVEALLLTMNVVRYSADDFVHLALMTYEHDTVRELTDGDLEVIVESTFLSEDDCRFQYSGEIPFHEDVILITMLLITVRKRLNVELIALSQLPYIEFEQVWVSKAMVTIVYEAPRGLYR